MSEKVIAITLFRRPEWTQKLFDSLGQCYGIEDYTILVHQDWSERYAQECRFSGNIADKWLYSKYQQTKIQHWFTAPNKNQGVDVSKLNVLKEAFRLSDYVILLEDDTSLAPDALRWFEFANEAFAHTDITSVSGYSRITGVPKEIIGKSLNGFYIEEGFKPWGWAMWRDRYEQFYGLDGAKYRAAVDNVNGLFDHHMSAQKRTYVHPVVGRTNHATWEHAEHTPNKEFWEKEENCPVGAWDFDLSANRESWGNL